MAGCSCPKQQDVVLHLQAQKSHLLRAKCGTPRALLEDLKEPTGLTG